MQKQWKLLLQSPDQAVKLAAELKVSPLIAQLLINRGVKTAKSGDEFLRPGLKNLADPLLLSGVVEGAKRVLLAKERGEKVVVFGDYDVDGVTGTSILIHTLHHLGLPADYYVPHRYDEGYGMSLTAVEEIAAKGYKLIITVDCGIGNHDEVARAKELGVDVIVTDHHNTPAKLPEAYAIINPKLMSSDHPSWYLAGAGVAFKFAWGLLRIAGTKDSVFLTSLLDLAALGTIADIVPLTQENRVLASAGISLINKRQRLGIRSLLDSAGIHGTISVRDISFGLAPRINAAGRLEHASRAIELFLSQESGRARELADELSRINVRRQGIGSSIKEEVFAMIDPRYIKDNMLVVLEGKDWHPGVVGIIASQVVDKFNRPAVLIGVNNGIARGSARSFDAINIYELLRACQDLFVDFGGHAGAAGFELKVENIPALKERLQAEAKKRIKPEQLVPTVEIEAEVDPSIISLNLIRELSLLDPHGEGNPSPIFISRGLKLESQRTVGADGKHLKAKFTNGSVSLEAIGFGLGDRASELNYNDKYDLAYNLSANEWNGFEVPQMSLIDMRRTINNE